MKILKTINSLVLELLYHLDSDNPWLRKKLTQGVTQKLDWGNSRRPFLRKANCILSTAFNHRLFGASTVLKNYKCYFSAVLFQFKSVSLWYITVCYVTLWKMSSSWRSILDLVLLVWHSFVFFFYCGFEGNMPKIFTLHPTTEFYIMFPCFFLLKINKNWTAVTWENPAHAQGPHIVKCCTYMKQSINEWENFHCFPKTLYEKVSP